MSQESVRQIAHLDMDAFFAAVEQLDHLAYRGRPVIVGGLGPRGVVATASYEARKYGVHSAIPMSRARRLCPEGVFLEARFERYREVSEKVRAILLSYTPCVEFVSVDEAFLDLSAHGAPPGSAETIAAAIKRRVRAETSLTCSVGLAPNRFLAKLASELKKPDGLLMIRPERVQEILDPLPVGAIWGVGQVTERRLRGLGLLTVRNLREAPLELLVRDFGAMGRALHRLARGEDETPVAPVRETCSISREVTLPQDLLSLAAVEATLRPLAREVAAELSREGLLGKVVRIKVRFGDFATITRQVSLAAPTDSPYLVEATAVDLLHRRVPLEDRGVRLIGVGVGRLCEARTQQLPLFADTHGLAKS